MPGAIRLGYIDVAERGDEMDREVKENVENRIKDQIKEILSETPVEEAWGVIKQFLERDSDENNT